MQSLEWVLNFNNRQMIATRSTTYKRKGFILTSIQRDNIRKLGIQVNEKTTEKQVLKLLRRKRNFKEAFKLADLHALKYDITLKELK